MVPEKLTVDASVAIKWFYRAEEKHVEVARLLAQNIKEGTARLVVPEIFYSELGNVFARDQGTSESLLREREALLFHLGIETVRMDAALWRSIINKAQAHRLTFYDASYLAVAEARRTDLITEDSDLLSLGLPYIKSLTTCR